MPKVTTERTIYTYSYLHLAGWSELKEAEQALEGRFFNCLASMLFCAFTLEAYLNHIGPMYVPNWWQKERNLGRRGRLVAVCQKLHFVPNLERRPFRTFSEIFDFRDALVHGRTVHLSTEHESKRMAHIPKYPKGAWEKQVALKAAGRFHNDTAKMIHRLHKLAGFSEDPFTSPWKASWESRP